MLSSFNFLPGGRNYTRGQMTKDLVGVKWFFSVWYSEEAEYVPSNVLQALNKS